MVKCIHKFDIGLDIGHTFIILNIQNYLLIIIVTTSAVCSDLIHESFKLQSFTNIDG